MKFTPDQIAQLAPDAASDKAGQKLAVSTKWPKLCKNQLALWGECQGSGKKPYKTAVDLSVLAFKCSCPSRKFPCKHAIGLLYLHCAQGQQFIDTPLETYVQEWLDSRAKRAEKAATKAEENEKKPVDEQAQQKRQQAREKKVTSGVQELRIWIKDLIRTGVMNVPQEQYHFAQTIRARMVDAQANGLANQLKSIEGIAYYKEGWQRSILQKLSRLYLLTEAYQNKEQLSQEWQEEIKSLVGWSHNKEEMLSLPSVSDQWLAWSRTVENEGNITTVRTWLYGLQNKRYALLLDFYANGQMVAAPISPGQVLQAQLCFYPGLNPLRALIKEQEGSGQLSELEIPLDGLQSIGTAYANSLALNPFIDRVPLLAGQLRLINIDGSFYIQDKEQCISPIGNSEAECWVIYSISGGHSFDAFLIKEDQQIHLHSLFIQQQLYTVKWA